MFSIEITIFKIFSLLSIIFSIWYLATLSPTVVTKTNIYAYISWLLTGIIAISILAILYGSNQTYNIDLIFFIYTIYGIISFFTIIYLYNMMVDGKSYNNTTIRNWRMVTSIMNILIMGLFGYCIYIDKSGLLNDTVKDTTKNHVVWASMLFVVFITTSIILWYLVNSSVIRYSITDG
jgi:hypothetical protein